jgi:hypothetical protein
LVALATVKADSTAAYLLANILLKTSTTMIPERILNVEFKSGIKHFLCELHPANHHDINQIPELEPT